MSSPTIGRTTPDTFTEQNDTFLDTGLGNMAARATILALFIIIGFVGNCVLVATIAQSQRLKGFRLNLFILSVAIVNLINCIVNMPLILGNAITEKWDYGDFVCRFNAFTIQLASIAMILGLLLMTLDRFTAVRCNNIERYTSILSPMRCNILIVYSWLHAFGFSAPLLFGIIPVKAFSSRYLCAIDSGASVVYLCLHSVLGYLIPNIIIIALFIYIITTNIRARIHYRKSSYSDDIPTQLTEVNTSKYVGVIFIFWSICEGPYLLITAIEQYKNSSIVRNANINLDFEYPWQVDLTVTWLKLSNAIVLPIITLFWRKEVWQKFKNCVLCRKSNLIVDASPKKTRRKKIDDKKSRGIESSNSVEMNSNGSFTVPVLFATPEGLHFQTYNNKKATNESSNETDIEKGLHSSSADSEVIATKCDVYGSQQFLDLDEGDTSDYDSEIDPFSGSNPISVHTKGSQENSRSNSIGLEGDKLDPKLDDSGYEFSVNSKERDKGGNKKDKREKCIDMSGEKREKYFENKGSEEIVDNKDVINDVVDNKDIVAVNDPDSGRGSSGENSIKKKKKHHRQTKERDTYENKNCDMDTADDNYPHNQKEGEHIDTNVKDIKENVNEVKVEENICDDIVPKRKKKGKKKAKTNMGVSNPAVIDDTQPTMPPLRRPAPARLIPIDNNSEYLEKLTQARGSEAIQSNEKHLATSRPLPILPERTTKRQTSEQPKTNSSNNTDDDNIENANNRDFKRSKSESMVSSDNPKGDVPTPAPRKSKSKTFLEEEKPVEKPMRRKERRRTTSQSTTDSQTQLLGNSDGSMELSDQSGVLKQKPDNAYGSTKNTVPLDNLPKLRKTKKKTQTQEA